MLHRTHGAMNAQLAPQSPRGIHPRVRHGLGDGSTSDSIQFAFNEANKQNTEQEVDDYLKRWFTSDPSSWPVGTEKIAVSAVGAAIVTQLVADVGASGVVGALATVAGVALAPFVGALAEISVTAINAWLGGPSNSTYCEHSEWRTKQMDDPLWIHYPRRRGVPPQGNTNYSVNGVPCANITANGDPGPNPAAHAPNCFPYLYGGVEHPGWGKLGLTALTPDMRDYPWISNLETSIRINFPTLIVLQIPYAAEGSFEDYWYRVYLRIKEINQLQDCIQLSTADANAQEESLLTAFVGTVWNPRHAPSANDTVYPGGAASGDDLLLAPHANDIHINRGSFITPLPTQSRIAKNVVGGLPNGLNLQSTRSIGNSGGMSTSEKIAVGSLVLAGLAAAGVGVFAWRKKIGYAEAWKETGHGAVRVGKTAGRGTVNVSKKAWSVAKKPFTKR